MVRQEKRFPLVMDGEVLVGENPVMNLYDESDLISNIKGPYQEREFVEQVATKREEKFDQITSSDRDLLPPIFQAKRSPYSRKERFQPKSPRELPTPAIKNQVQLAREQAKEDLKKKRSKFYLRDERAFSPKLVEPSLSETTDNPKGTRLTPVANKLRQTEYILATMPAVYSLKKENRGKEPKVPKNSYDFLKKSQVYNYPERKKGQERQVAQELNLTHIEEETNDKNLSFYRD